MKTLKALTISSILHIAFCLCCIASVLCFAISNYAMAHNYDWRIPFAIANILIYGWIVNPVAPISFIVCLFIFLIERKRTETRSLIGKKWIWILVWPLISAFFYFSSLMLSVAFTGGV